MSIPPLLDPQYTGIAEGVVLTVLQPGLYIRKFQTHSSGVHEPAQSSQGYMYKNSNIIKTKPATTHASVHVVCPRCEHQAVAAVSTIYFLQHYVLLLPVLLDS